MATVHHASHRLDGTPVAIKVLLPDFARQSSFVENFTHEVRGVAALLHPRITAIYDHGVIPEQQVPDRPELVGTPWLAMELVDGKPLTAHAGRLEWPRLRTILLQLLGALAHAHARRFIHRDIKPGNVLLSQSTGDIKLTDFGLVQSVASIHDLKRLGGADVQGTPSYMAPEQFEGDAASIGPWTDLYALGAAVWTLVCGKPPYQGSVEQRYMLHQAGILPSFTPRVAVPRGLLDWISHAMQPEPRRRYRHAADAARALRRLAGSVPEALDTQSWWLPSQAAAEPEAVDLAALDAETRTLSEVEGVASSDVSETAAQFGWSLGDGPTDAEALVGASEVAAPPRIPADWRTRMATPRHLHGAGLTLYSLRERGVVGREREREHLWRQLRRVVARDRAGVTVLEGTAGIGKTTLAQWLAWSADERGHAQWVKVHHGASDGLLSALGAALATHLRLVGLDRSSALHRVQDHLAALGLHDVELAVGLVQIARPDADVEDAFGMSVHFGSHAEQVASVVRLLVATAGHRPVVLWLEDIHHAPGAWMLVEQLLEHDSAGPIQVVCTAASESGDGSEDLDACLAARAEDDRVHRLEVGPFSTADGALFVQDLLGLELSLAAEVEARCAGNPRFAVQLVADWVERGLLEPGAGGFALRQEANVAIPDTLLDIWRQRRRGVLDDLAPARIAAVELGAVLGNDVDQREWEAAQEQAGVASDASLMDALQRRRLIVVHPKRRGWSFVHALFRESVLEWAREHGRLAPWSAACAAVLPREPVYVARRAQLLVEAGRSEEALDPLGAAVLLEFDRNEMGRARSLFAQRSAILAQMPEAETERRAYHTDLLSLLLLPDAKRREVLRTEAARYLERAHGFDDQDGIIRLSLLQGVDAYLRGEPSVSMGLFEQALERSRRTRSRHFVNAANRVAFVALQTGDLTRSEEASREAIFAAEAAGQTRRVGHSYMRMADVSRQRGCLERARFYLDEARIRLERTGDRIGLASAANTLGSLAGRMGDFAAAEQAYLEAARRFRLLGSGNRHEVSVHVNLGFVYIRMERFGEARGLLEPVAGCAPEHQAAEGISAPIHAFACLGRAICRAEAQSWHGTRSDLVFCAQTFEALQIYEGDVLSAATLCAEVCAAAGRAELAELARTIADHQRQGLAPSDDAPSDADP